MTADPPRTGPAARPRSRLTRLGPLAILGALLLAFALNGAWRLGQERWGIDYFHFWVAPQAVSTHEISDVYAWSGRDELRARVSAWSGRVEQGERFHHKLEHWQPLEPTGTPLFYTVLAPIALDDYERAYGTFQAIGIVCAVISILWTCSWLGYTTGEALIACVFVLTWYEPFLSDVRAGNANRYHLLLLVLFLAVQRWRSPARDVVAGLALALACGFNPVSAIVPLAVAAVHVGARRWGVLARGAIGLVLGSVCGWLMSVLYFGEAGVWGRWLHQMLNNPQEYTVSMGNHAAVAVLPETLGRTVVLASIPIVLGSAFLAVRCCRGAPDHGRELAQVHLATGLGVLLFCLVSPLVWLHHFLLTVPLFLFLLRPAGTAHRSVWPAVRRLVTGVALAAISLSPLITFLGVKRPHSFGAITLAGTGVLIVVAVADLYHGARRH